MAFKMSPKSPFLQKLPQFKQKVKNRGNKTIIKTKQKGSNYRSKIVLDQDDNITKAKSTDTKDKYKKDPRRLKRAKWLDRDLAGYRGIKKEQQKQQDKFYKSYGL